jgi:HEAT repeat protein
VDLDLLGDAALESVGTLLSLLPPEALGTLVPMIPAARGRRVRRVLMTAAVRLARRDARPLAPFLEGTPAPEPARYLIEVVRRLSEGTASRMLFRLVRHPDRAVRERALEVLLSRNEIRPEVFSPLLDDPDPAIREAVLHRLGRGRDRVAEGLLLDRLESAADRDAERRAAVIGTLGRCGSDAALPRLRSFLLGRPWRMDALRGRLRSAAARAIADLDSAEAESLLARAARSPFPAVRRAAWDALEDRT